MRRFFALIHPSAPFYLFYFIVFVLWKMFSLAAVSAVNGGGDGMGDPLEPCAKVMAEHTACFQEWLPRFVHGEVRESGCTAEYEAQQACVLEQLRAVGLGRLVTEWRPLQLDRD